MLRPELDRYSRGVKDIDDADFFRRALAAVKKRRGLIHGQLEKAGKVCALGALRNSMKPDEVGIGIWRRTVEALQAVNDSVPGATPAKRRLVVIKWLEEQLK